MLLVGLESSAGDRDVAPGQLGECEQNTCIHTYVRSPACGGVCSVVMLTDRMSLYLRNFLLRTVDNFVHLCESGRRSIFRHASGYALVVALTTVFVKDDSMLLVYRLV